MLRKVSYCLLLFTVLINSAFAQPPETGWISNTDHLPLRVNLQLTGQVEADKGAVNALLSVTLDGDWKTYWRSPGEGGVAPTFNWSAQSSNINAVEWVWPTPGRYPVFGVETVGYKDQINFPITLILDDEKEVSHLKGVLTLASCTTICVLTDYEIDLTFDPNTLEVDDNIAFSFAQAMSLVPVKVTQKAITTQQNNANITGLIASWDQLNQKIIVQLSHQVAWQSPDLFIDSFDPELMNVFYSAPSILLDDKQVTATFDVSTWSGEVDLSQANINITIVDENVSVEVAAVLSNQPIDTSREPVASIFLIALLGGLILNIMPCVLPVLGMKLSSVLGVDGSERSQIRKQFLASSVGIISSFWILAIFLLLLKSSGEALGWGIQFQNIYFIVFMISITALFTANMLGLFEIQLPSSMQTWLATKGGHSYLGHYLQGMFATLLATPCSAPFLGTAVAFALGASTWQLFAIFTALGLGMALPWLVIALFPSVASLIPKPGKWMGVIKLIFGLLILITCLWLVSLLSSFIGNLYAIVVALVLLAIFAWLIVQKHGMKVLMIIFSCLLMLTASIFIIASLTAKYWSSPIKDDITWTPLEVALIEQQVAQGHVIFVDVTADWCVTCKANKAGVLLQEPVYSALHGENVVTMKGDWTVRSDSITNYLRSFGRYGVPFNVVYGPGAPNGIELSTILNSTDVIDALQQAKGRE